MVNSPWRDWMSVGLALFVSLNSPSFGADVPPNSVYGSWSMECNDEGKCAATQKVSVDPQGAKVVLGVIVEVTKEAKTPQITFRLSNQAYLPAGAGMKIDDREPMRAPISACNEEVCEVRAWLTPKLAAMMRKGRLLVFAYFVDAKRQVSLPVSLNGFATAHDQLMKNARR